MSQSSYSSPQRATRKAVPRLPTLLGVVDEYETLLQDYPQLTDRLSGMISTITAHVVHEKVETEGKGAIVVPVWRKKWNS